MFMATFSGLVCFSVLGNMAYTYGIDFTEVINAGNKIFQNNFLKLAGSLSQTLRWPEKKTMTSEVLLCLYSILFVAKILTVIYYLYMLRVMNVCNSL